MHSEKSFKTRSVKKKKTVWLEFFLTILICSLLGSKSRNLEFLGGDFRTNVKVVFSIHNLFNSQSDSDSLDFLGYSTK